VSAFNNSAFFKKGDLDIAMLKNTLKKGRKSDIILLSRIGLSLKELPVMTELQAVLAFNEILNFPDFHSQLDTQTMKLDPDAKVLLKKAEQTTKLGHTMEREDMHNLNRALLQTIYPKETSNSYNVRKFKRFSASAFLNIKVKLAPLPPYFGDPTFGHLIDLSAGGLALQVGELIPQHSRWALIVSFPDRTELKAIVQVRHVSKRNQMYLHGLEFLNISELMSTKIDQMATDYLECDERIENKDPKICLENCSFFNVCTKPQRMKPQLNKNLTLDVSLKKYEEK